MPSSVANAKSLAAGTSGKSFSTSVSVKKSNNKDSKSRTAAGE